jgi:hypothetical protein
MGISKSEAPIKRSNVHTSRYLLTGTFILVKLLSENTYAEAKYHCKYAHVHARTCSVHVHVLGK